MIDLDIKDFIGITLDEAMQLATSKNMTIRVVKKDDGVSFVRTFDFVTSRVNVEIVKNKVVIAAIG